MLFMGKKEHYSGYKRERNNFIYYLDEYKLLKNVYYSSFGNNDIDVLGI